MILFLFLRKRIRFVPTFRTVVSVYPSFIFFKVLDLPNLQGDKNGDVRFSKKPRDFNGPPLP